MIRVRATTSRRSHPGRRGHPIGDFWTERIVLSHRSLERSVRRSTILLPNHFRRLILQFEFARACARNHPLALPAHIPAIKRKWTLDRPISLRSFPSSSCCDIPPSRVSLALPAPLHALFSFSSSIPIISREYV